MKDLRNKKVVITGAATGIGKASALAFADQGCDLFIITSKNVQGLDGTKKEIEAKGRKCWTKMVDISKREQMEELVNDAIKEMGHIDIFMNNAGVGLGGEVKDLKLSDWEWIMNINFWGAIYGMHYVIPHMIERKSGYIVNVASAAGLFTAPGLAPYCASKFAVVGASEAIHGELSRHNIGMTCVCPAFVRTEIFKTTRTVGMKDFDRSIFDKFGLRPPTVAKAIIKAVKKNQYLLVLTPEGKFFYHFKRLLPGAYFQVGPIQAWINNKYQSK